jgi:hypothetical protein
VPSNAARVGAALSTELRDVLAPLLKEIESLNEGIKEYDEANGENRQGSVVVRQFAVPNMKRISFCLAQALRFGIAG